MFFRSHRFTIVPVAKPGQARANLYGHAELPALAFIKYKIGIIAQVMKFQVVVNANLFASEAANLKLIAYISVEPAIAKAHPQFPAETQAEPNPRYLGGRIVEKRVA